MCGTSLYVRYFMTGRDADQILWSSSVIVCTYLCACVCVCMCVCVCVCVCVCACVLFGGGARGGIGCMFMSVCKCRCQCAHVRFPSNLDAWWEDLLS